MNSAAYVNPQVCAYIRRERPQLIPTISLPLTATIPQHRHPPAPFCPLSATAPSLFLLSPVCHAPDSDYSDYTDELDVYKRQ